MYSRVRLFMICVRISCIGCVFFCEREGVQLFWLNGHEKVGLVDFLYVSIIRLKGYVYFVNFIRSDFASKNCCSVFFHKFDFNVQCVFCVTVG